MKYKNFSISLILLFSFTGCASLPPLPSFIRSPFSVKKKVVNNTFYSTRMPSIRVEVQQDLQFVELIHEVRVPIDSTSGLEGSHSEMNRSTVHYPISSDTGSRSEEIKFDKAIFRNTYNGSELTIKTSVNAASAENMRWDSPDYSGYPNILKYHDATIGGKQYAVGIYPYTSTNGAVHLVKKFGRLFGLDTKFEVFYSEQVSMEWSNIRILNIEQDNFLKEFSRRADDSFKILAYADPSATADSKAEGATTGINSAIATASNEDTRSILEYIKHAGDALDATTRAGLIESALSTATNQNTINILKTMK